MMYGTPKEREAFNLVVVCIIATVCFWGIYGLCRVFSSPSSGGPGAAISDAPVRQAARGVFLTVFPACGNLFRSNTL